MNSIHNTLHTHTQRRGCFQSLSFAIFEAFSQRIERSVMLGLPSVAESPSEENSETNTFVFKNVQKNNQTSFSFCLFLPLSDDRCSIVLFILPFSLLSQGLSLLCTYGLLCVDQDGLRLTDIHLPLPLEC